MFRAGQRALDALEGIWQKVGPSLAATLWPCAEFSMTPNVHKWPNLRGRQVLFKKWWRKVSCISRKYGDREVLRYKTPTP